MSARELEQLRLRQQQLEGEVERLRQLVHEASARPSQTAQCSDSTAGLLKAILDSATDYAIFTMDLGRRVTFVTVGCELRSGGHGVRRRLSSTGERRSLESTLTPGTGCGVTAPWAWGR